MIFDHTNFKWQGELWMVNGIAYGSNQLQPFPGMLEKLQKISARWPMFCPRFEPVSCQIQIRNFAGDIPLCFDNLIITKG